MNILALIIHLISGAIGGNIASGLLKNLGLGRSELSPAHGARPTVQYTEMLASGVWVANF